MSKKAFSMTSNQYCGNCGSFDLVKKSSGLINRRVLGVKPYMYCYGCDDEFHEGFFVNNAIRTLPLTVDDFFFQTNLRNQELLKRQIKPLTQAAGLCLIAIAITGLLLVSPSGEFQSIDKLKIKWATKSVESYEKDIVKALQLEFNKLVKVD